MYVSRWQKVYKVNVIITYRSDNVIRFVIFAGQTKYILAEKWLFRKSQPWKLPYRNFNVIGSDKEKREAGEVMKDIIRGIEDYLKPKVQRGPHWKNDFDIR